MKGRECNWKNGILADVKRHRKKEKSEGPIQNYKQRYSRSKTFVPLKNPNMNKHFYFPKMVTEPDYNLSASALTVYPIMCSRSDFEKNKWVSNKSSEYISNGRLLVIHSLKRN